MVSILKITGTPFHSFFSVIATLFVQACVCAFYLVSNVVLFQLHIHNDSTKTNTARNTKYKEEKEQHQITYIASSSATAATAAAKTATTTMEKKDVIWIHKMNSSILFAVRFAFSHTTHGIHTICLLLLGGAHIVRILVCFPSLHVKHFLDVASEHTHTKSNTSRFFFCSWVFILLLSVSR